MSTLQTVQTIFDPPLFVVDADFNDNVQKRSRNSDIKPLQSYLALYCTWYDMENVHLWIKIHITDGLFPKNLARNQ